MPDTVMPAAAAPGRFKIHWGRAITAGFVATVVMTVVMMLLRMNLVKMLGSMIADASASTATQYAAGGAVHLMIGLAYGVVYAALFGWVVEWNRVLKGAVFGLAITAIALAAMPVMSAMMGGGKTKATAKNPCQSAKSGNPCNPCNPSNPCNPCNRRKAGNPCNPCSSGGGGAWSGALSAVNHLVYALALAAVYEKPE